MKTRLQANEASVLPVRGRVPWLELAVLAGIIWLAHFQLFHALGLYEDDYAFIGRQLGWKPADLLEYMKAVATWPQGRPIQFLLPRALTVLAGYLDGIRTLYVFAFVLQAVNGFMFYFLLRRLGVGASALPGAVIFSLYPADTTHTFLMHALGAHPALTFLLIAAHCYLSGHKWVAHLVSAGSLLTYESAYLPFLAMPLLAVPWGKPLRKEWPRHALTWLSILVLAVAVRAMLGEDRIESLAGGSEISQLIGHIGLGLIIGPGVSLSLLGIGPAWVMVHWQTALSLLFVIALAAFAWVLSHSSRATDLRGSRSRPTEAIGAQRGEGRGSITSRQLVQLLLAALAMLSLAYGFSFTHFPPTVQYGRATSVHLASAAGGALLVACLHALVMRRLRTRDGRATVTLLLALYLSLLAAYRFAIQIDFREAWSNQRAFWAQIIPLVPDASDGTMIFVLDHDLPRTRFIYTNSWADPIVLAQLYEFPGSWTEPPRVFVIPTDWTNSIVREGQTLRWEVPAATWPAHWEELPDGNVILLEMEDGRMVRRSATLEVSDHQLSLRPLPQGRRLLFPEGPLNRHLLGAQ